MIGLLLLALIQGGIETSAGRPGGRTYHPVTVARLPTTTRTHVRVCGLVTLVRKEEDGDVHVRLSDGARFAVAEIVPAIPLPRPRLGQRICVDGISREDKAHRWFEIHPLEAWRPMARTDRVSKPKGTGDGTVR